MYNNFSNNQIKELIEFYFKIKKPLPEELYNKCKEIPELMRLIRNRKLKLLFP